MSKCIRRGGFTLIELLAVSAIIAIVISITVPAIQSARESARRVQCKNNLKQVGLALHSYHENFGSLPSGFIGVDNAGRPEVSGPTGWGWAAMILPQLDQVDLYEKIDFGAPILDARNDAARTTMLTTFRCPTDSSPALFDLKAADGETKLATLATSNYVGNFGAGTTDYCGNLAGSGKQCESGFDLKNTGLFYHNSSEHLDRVSDGTSHTLMVGERSTVNGDLMKAASWLGSIPGAQNAYGLNLGSATYSSSSAFSKPEGFSTAHPGIVDLLMADGHVNSTSIKMDAAVMMAMVTRNGGDTPQGLSASTIHARQAIQHLATIYEAKHGDKKPTAEPKMFKRKDRTGSVTTLPLAPNDPSHFLFPLPDGGHGAWNGATPSTEGPIIIKYDFRDFAGFANEITDAEKSVAQAAANLWSEATCGKVVFQLDATAPDEEIIILGKGDLAAVGDVSEPFGVLARGGGQLSGNSIVSGVTWMDSAEVWDTIIGNGDPDPNNIDFMTVLCHEFGHAIGMAHLDDMPGDNSMNSIYNGEQLALSPNDIAVFTLIYGTDCTDGPGPGGGLPAGWIRK